MKRVGLCSTAVSTLMALSMTNASAQVDEIVITAQKRAENQQDVPIAVQSIQGDQLNKLGIGDAGDITDLLANVNTNAANEVNNGFTIRGVGTNNFHGNVARAVGVYQDEVSRGTPFSSVLGVYDMERIEVLRGPQNTLFGRNTTGGAINYISKKPSLGEGMDGYALATFGSFGQEEFEGAVGFGLSETFGFRVSGQSVKRDGLFMNVAPGREGEELGKRDRQSFRVQALWAPTDATEVLLSYSNAENNGTNIGNKAIGQRDPNDPRLPCPELATLGGTSSYESVNSCVDSFGNNPSLDSWKGVYNTSSATQDVSVDTAFAKVTHEFDGGVTLTSITAIDNTDVLNADDTGGTQTLYFQPNQDAEYEQFSQELRLQGDREGFRWILGGYYFQEDLRLATIVRRDANGGVTPPFPPGPGAGQVNPYNFLDQEDTDISIYGQGEWDLNDQTTITAGLRYTDNSKEAVSLFGVVFLPVDPFVGAAQTFPANQVLTQNFIQGLIDGGQGQAVPQFNVECGTGQGTTRPCANGEDGVIEQDIEEVGGKIGIDHKLDNGALLYASYSRGFKAGGFDTRALAALNGDATQAVSQETLDVFEAGFKWDSDDNTLRINGAAFFNKWNDQQVFAVVNGIPGFVNIPESELYGLELEALWAPDETWLFSGSLGLLESEITDAGNLSGVDTGHELTNNPPLSLTGSVSKDIPMGKGTLNLFSKFRYQDESLDNLNFNSAVINGVTVTQDSLSTHDEQFELDVRVTYSFGPDEKYSVSAFGNNLTEERYCNDIGFVDSIGSTDVGPAGANGALTTTGACSPSDGQKLYGVTLRAEF